MFWSQDGSPEEGESAVSVDERMKVARFRIRHLVLGERVEIRLLIGGHRSRVWINPVPESEGREDYFPGDLRIDQKGLLLGQ